MDLNNTLELEGALTMQNTIRAYDIKCPTHGVVKDSIEIHGKGPYCLLCCVEQLSECEKVKTNE